MSTTRHFCQTSYVQLEPKLEEEVGRPSLRVPCTAGIGAGCTRSAVTYDFGVNGKRGRFPVKRPLEKALFPSRQRDTYKTGG